MTDPRIVDRDTWLAARRRLLSEEKAFDRARDALSAQRRAMPAVRISKDYRFETEAGPRGLSDLFAGRRQLILYHFMFAADWEAGCKSCSFWGDGFERLPIHLAARDTAFSLVSVAPLDKLVAYRARMGWTLDWVSSEGTTFNADFAVGPPGRGDAPFAGYNFTDDPPSGEMPGLSVFLRGADGSVLHTYSTHARGVDLVNAAYHLLDLTPIGRDEDEIGIQSWVRRRDEYGT